MSLCLEPKSVQRTSICPCLSVPFWKMHSVIVPLDKEDFCFCNAAGAPPWTVTEFYVSGLIVEGESDKHQGPRAAKPGDHPWECDKGYNLPYKGILIARQNRFMDLESKTNGPGRDVACNRGKEDWEWNGSSFVSFNNIKKTCICRSLIRRKNEPMSTIHDFHTERSPG